MPIIIERKFAMPNKWTFEIEPIKELLRKEMNGGIWIDPFAGLHSPAHIRNDLNPNMRADYHIDALEFLKSRKSESADGVLFDPPYSTRQISECYKSVGRQPTSEDTSALFWSRIRDEIARITKPGGKVISCGWNSIGIGKTRGFEMKYILLCVHGGAHHDTIVTIETKINQSLGMWY